MPPTRVAAGSLKPNEPLCDKPSREYTPHAFWMLGEGKAWEHAGQTNESVSWHGVRSKDLFVMDRLIYGCKDLGRTGCGNESTSVAGASGSTRATACTLWAGVCLSLALSSLNLILLNVNIIL